MNILTQDRNTPLHNAAAYGHLDTVKLLVQKQATLKRKNRVSHSLFQHALSIIMIMITGAIDSIRCCKKEETC